MMCTVKLDKLTTPLEKGEIRYYRKSSNKDRDSIRGRASDSSRGIGRYGQIKTGPRIQARGKKKVPVAYFTVAYQNQSISTKQTSQFN